MLRRVSALLSLCVLTGAIPLLAQSYQTSFSEVKFDRGRTPATLHGHADVDSASGALSVDVPLGPGIGARGAVFQPHYRLRWAPEFFVRSEPHLTNPSVDVVDPSNGAILIRRTDYEQWGPSTIADTWSSWDHTADGGLNPGSLDLPQSPVEQGALTPSFVLPDGRSSAFKLGALPAGASSTQLLADFGYVGATVASFAYGPDPANPTHSSLLQAVTPSGDIVLGLAGSAYSAATSSDQSMGTQAAPMTIYYSDPATVLVVSGGAAYEYQLESWHTQVVHHASIDSTGHLTLGSPFPCLRRAHYILRRIVNRFGDAIVFNNAPGGTDDQVSFTATWTRNGLSTGVSVQATFIPPTGTATAGSIRISYTGGNQSSYLLTPGNPVLVDAPDDTVNNTYNLASGGGSVGSRSLRETYNNLFFLASVQEEATGQSVSFAYANAAAFDKQYRQGTSTGSALLTQINEPGRQLSYTWTAYSYRRNFAAGPDWSGYYGDQLISPSYVYGVTRIDDASLAGSSVAQTRTTTHERTLPSPVLGSASGTDWTSTIFQDKVTTPDGQITLYSFVPPVPGDRGDSNSSTANQLQTQQHLKHTLQSVQRYDGYLSFQNNQPYQSVTYSAVDLRSVGDPAGTPSLGVVPYWTTTTTQDLDRGVTTTEQLDTWDTVNLGWQNTLRSVTGPAGSFHKDDRRTLNTDLGHWLVGQVLSDTKTGQAAVATTYDNAHGGRVSSIASNSGASPALTLTYTYTDATSNPASVSLTGTNTAGSAAGASYTYDAKGFLASIAVNGIAGTISQVADGLGRPTSQTDRNGFTTGFGYDPAGRLASITPPSPEVASSIAYDPDNLGASLTRGSQSSAYRYSGYGDLVLEKRLDGSTWSSTEHGYDALGHHIWDTTWRAGAGSDADWTAALGPDDTSTTTPGWTETTNQCAIWHYDGSGQPDYCLKYKVIVHPPVTTVAYHHSTHTQYDGRGRVTQVTNPNGEVVATSYGAAALSDGNSSRTVTVAPGDADHQQVTVFESDPLGRLSKVIDALNQVTAYTYDDGDRTTKVQQFPTSSQATDTWTGAGTPQVRSWAYNGLGWLTSLVQPESGTTSYSSFTVLGKPTSTVYGAGSASPLTVTTGYDASGRVTSVSGTGVSQSFTFDSGTNAKGQLSSATDGGITRALAYAGLNGRLSGMTTTLDSQTFSQSLAYDIYGKLTSRTYPDGRVQVIAYDDASSLPKSSTYNGAALVSTLGYDPTSWLLNQISWANGASSSFTYRDDQSSLATMNHAIPGQLSKAWTFSYDAAGNLGTDNEDWYSYDRLGRLTQAYVRDLSGSTSAGLWQKFSYDAFGNRTALSSQSITNWPATQAPPATPSSTALTGDPRNLQTYTMSAAEVSAMAATNHLPATLGGVATGVGASGYDAQGNLKTVYKTPGQSGTQLGMAYDALGRVTSVADASRGVTETYSYDDQGLRMRIWDGTIYRYNLYDEGRKLVAQYTKTPSGSLTWKDDVLYVGTKEVAQVGSDGKTRITLEDHLGSPRYEWDGSSGTATYIQQKFLPFGESLAVPTASALFAKGFTNHEQTDLSGLVYMQARFYLPSYGRFISPDPLGDQHFEMIQNWGTYVYTKNNPTNKFDPDGKNARVRIMGNTIIITVPIVLSGSGATQKFASTMRDKIIQGWDNHGLGWSREDHNGKTWHMHVIPQIKISNTDVKPNSATNTMFVFTRSHEDGGPNSSEVTNNQFGRIKGNADKVGAPPILHEFWHYLYSEDKAWEEGPRSGTPFPGFEHNIMALPGDRGDIEPDKNIQPLLDYLVDWYENTDPSELNPNNGYDADGVLGDKILPAHDF